MSNTGPHDQPDEAMVDLLIKQVTEGLTPDEQRELERLDSTVADTLLPDLERAAAAIALGATASATEQLPPSLQARIEQQAQTFLAEHRPVEFKAARQPPAAEPLKVSRAGAAGWIAAAACLLLAVFGWLRPLQPPSAPPAADVHVTAPPAPVPPAPEIPQAPPSPAEERAALMARPDTMKVNLGATKDPIAAGVSGDAVWDPVTQRGFLHFAGLPPNDPNVHQYQIWIFDGARDKRYPVDGGVFDVPANASEVVIPIRAALLVRAAKGFAVTVEKPGGVVVSGLHHVVVLGTAT
ncbi:MAG: Anti-sigma-K factor rskA [Gammaproteobacteria bacterium]|nr:Anti-sigma-K factor rskA [Gammaproteobacteria bacterium]